MSTKKIKLLKEIQETLKGKHLSHSRKFKSKLKVETEDGALLCVFGCYNRFLTMYMRSATIYTTYRGRLIRITLSGHFIERFKLRYSNADKWKFYVVKELTTILNSYSKIEYKPIKVKTRHGWAVVVRCKSGSIKCITYVSVWNRRLITPPMDAFIKIKQEV